MSTKRIKSALVSVFYKDGLDEIIKMLHAEGVQLISTGGTQQFIESLGIPCTAVESLTGYPSILGGRVKTLHPKVFGGILGRRELEKDQQQMAEYEIPEIDLVIVDLYPFEQTVASGAPEADIIEKIDIGGISLIRAAAKNFQDVIVLTDPADYAETISGLKAGNVPFEFRRKLAGKVFNLTSAYDAAVSRFMLEDELPTYYDMPLVKSQSLRYGENGHQKAALYVTADKKGAFSGMTQLQGKELQALQNRLS